MNFTSSPYTSVISVGTTIMSVGSCSFIISYNVFSHCWILVLFLLVQQ